MVAQPGQPGAGYPKPRDDTYRVVCGDVLEIHMPAILRIASTNLADLFQKVEPYLCRVADDGIICLPIIGPIEVAGKTFTEIEALIAGAYFPMYVRTRPAVVCKVKEHRSQRVFTVMGLVSRPDTFPYPPDVQYNLMEAVAFAGGVDMLADPHYVKVYRRDSLDDIVCAVFRIDGQYLTNACSVVIKPGDVIYIDQTLHTRINSFLASVLHIGVGADMRYYGR
jgi:protein involved in polysaccharide export with SLBB domain